MRKADIPTHLLKYFRPKTIHKPKDDLAVPHRLYHALQDDGWWVRGDYVWAKKNPMPSSVKDRAAQSHEYVFHLAKSARYFWDADAVREKAKYGRRKWSGENLATAGIGGYRAKASVTGGDPSTGRNMRSVLFLATEPLRDEHYAAFPKNLVRPYILASTSAHGCCAKCGAPWRRVTKPTSEYARLLGRDWSKPEIDAAEGRGKFALPDGGTAQQRGVKRDSVHCTADYETIGWQPVCKCYDDRYREDYPQARRERKRWQRDRRGDWWRRVRKRAGLPHWPTEPCVVLDPFSGSGTSGLVAAELGRRAIIIDLKREYLEIAARRLAKAEKKHRDKTLELDL